jgi:hypothetical protein
MEPALMPSSRRPLCGTTIFLFAAQKTGSIHAARHAGQIAVALVRCLQCFEHRQVLHVCRLQISIEMLSQCRDNQVCYLDDRM